MNVRVRAVTAKGAALKRWVTGDALRSERVDTACALPCMADGVLIGRKTMMNVGIRGITAHVAA